MTLSDRQHAYTALAALKTDGHIRAYIASQRFPRNRWGFRVTMPDGSEFMFLPREALAFAEGVRAVERAHPFYTGGE
jgi:dUTPase